MHLHVCAHADANASKNLSNIYLFVSKYVVTIKHSSHDFFRKQNPMKKLETQLTTPVIE